MITLNFVYLVRDGFQHLRPAAAFQVTLARRSIRSKREKRVHFRKELQNYDSNSSTVKSVNDSIEIENRELNLLDKPVGKSRARRTARRETARREYAYDTSNKDLYRSKNDFSNVHNSEITGAPHLGKMFFTKRARPHAMYGGKMNRDTLKRWKQVLSTRTNPQLKNSFRKFLDRVEKCKGNFTYMGVPVGFEHKPKPPKVSLKSDPPSPQTLAVYGPNETFAYVSHRILPAYSIIRRVLEEAKEHMSGFEPESHFDFGSGPGTAVLAARNAWGLELDSESEEDMYDSEYDSDLQNDSNSQGDSDSQNGSDSSSEDDSDSDKELNEKDSETHTAEVKYNKEHKKLLSDVRLIENSRSMRDAAEVMLGALPGNGVRISISSNLIEASKAALAQGKTYDLVTATYSIAELPNAEQRAAVCALLWRLVKPNGALVVVEHGDARGSHVVRSIRQAILDGTEGYLAGSADEYTEAGGKLLRKRPPGKARIVAPCRHDRRCPMGDENNLGICKFYHQVPKTSKRLQDNAALGNESFSYVIIQKSTNDELPSSDLLNPVSLLRTMVEASKSEKPREEFERAMADLEQKITDGNFSDSQDPDEQKLAEMLDTAMVRSDWSRIIRNPSKANQHVLLHLCSPDGSLNRIVMAKNRWKHSQGLYIAARKSRLGGLWPWLPELYLKKKSEEESKILEDSEDIDSIEGDVSGSEGKLKKSKSRKHVRAKT